MRIGKDLFPYFVFFDFYSFPLFPNAETFKG